MPIDRPDPVDAPGAPDGPAAPDTPRPRGTPLPPPDTADHDAYRARVERSYAAHRDRTAWAEAVPQLREARAEHQQQYPERGRTTPRTHPDNSWTSGETRRLTPDQNTEATKACADIRQEGKRVILPTMQHIEAADPDRRLAGLEHMCKGADRLKEKIAERLRYHPDLPPRQAVADVPDAVLRRFAGGERRDESFGRDQEWKFSSLLHAAERGDTEYDLIPITEAEANHIVARMRDTARPAE